MRYAHQGGMNPPLVVIHGNSLEHVTDSYKRFLEGRCASTSSWWARPAHRDAQASNPFDEGRLGPCPGSAVSR
jgi:GTP-binding protein